MKAIQFSVLALLVLIVAGSGCRKEGAFDIRGEWSFSSASEELYVFRFVGSLEAGTLVEVDYPNDGAGDYSVAGEEIEFEFASTLVGGRSCHFSGSFTADDQISGTMELVAPYPPFTWTLEVEGRRL
jgi:hypothetical protein